MKRLVVILLLSLLPCAADAAVVYTQPHDGSATLMQSSGNGMDYDKYVWDNFTLSSDQDISEIRWRGGYDPQIPPVYPSSQVWYFDVSIWGTVAGQPNIGAAPLALYEMVPNNEAPAGTFNGTPMYDYSFSLAASPFTPFHAVAGTEYWVRIGAYQSGVPGWALAAGSGGNNQHFESYVNYAGGTAYLFKSGDAAFTLLNAAPIPTLSEWGIMIFATLAFAFVVLQRRGQRVFGRS